MGYEQGLIKHGSFLYSLGGPVVLEDFSKTGSHRIGIKRRCNGIRMQVISAEGREHHGKEEISLMDISECYDCDEDGIPVNGHAFDMTYRHVQVAVAPPSDS